MISYKKYKALKRSRLHHHQACCYVALVNCGVRFLSGGDMATTCLTSPVEMLGLWYHFSTYHNQSGTLIGSSKIELKKGDL